MEREAPVFFWLPPVCIVSLRKPLGMTVDRKASLNLLNAPLASLAAPVSPWWEIDLGGSWKPFWASWKRLGGLFKPLGVSWKLLGASWKPPGACWGGRLGGSWNFLASLKPPKIASRGFQDASKTTKTSPRSLQAPPRRLQERPGDFNFDGKKNGLQI